MSMRTTELSEKKSARSSEEQLAAEVVQSGMIVAAETFGSERDILCTGVAVVELECSVAGTGLGSLCIVAEAEHQRSP